MKDYMTAGEIYFQAFSVNSNMSLSDLRHVLFFLCGNDTTVGDVAKLLCEVKDRDKGFYIGHGLRYELEQATK